MIEMWVNFPYFPYFLIGYQIVGFFDFFLILGVFLGRNRRYIDKKNTNINNVIVYSTL